MRSITSRGLGMLAAACLAVAPACGDGGSSGDGGVEADGRDVADDAPREALDYWVPPPGDTDWPQLAHDARRTGWSAEFVEGPYRFTWRWTGVPFASRAQPVVVGERLYMGALDGAMYAVAALDDNRGGPPTIAWRTDLGSPIRAGAAVDGDIVVVGTHDGRVVGLHRGNGEVQWSFATGGAILASPAIDDGVAYLGSADGTFYALRTADGSVVWERPIGPPILGSAAVGETAGGKRVVFVAEDVAARALDAATGAVVWSTQIEGQSGADRWPVILGDTVFLRTQPVHFFHTLLHDGDDVMDSAGEVRADWAEDWEAVRPRILEHLTSQPTRQTLFALELATGASRGVAPVLYVYGNNDAPAPPAVWQSALYLPYRARHGIATDGGSVHVSTRYDGELGRLDPNTLDVTGLTSPDPYTYQWRATSDEPATVTVAGDRLLVDNWERLGAISLVDGRMTAIAQLYNGTDPGCDAPGVGGPMPAFYEHCVPGYTFTWDPVRPEGGARTGAVVASGRIFWSLDAALGALAPDDGTTNPPLAPFEPPPDPGPPPSAVPASDYDPYIDTEPTRPAPAPDPALVERLEAEVLRVLEADDHLLPLYVERGFQGTGSWPPDTTSPPGPTSVMGDQGFWYDPGELVYSLAIAYPYLSPPLQERLRAYLAAEMTRYPPLEPLPYGEPWDWVNRGRPREWHPLSIREEVDNCWPPPAPPLQTLYALWAYARYVGDWDYLAARWAEIDALFDEKRTEIDSYAEIAGAIGYARIAARLGHAPEAAEGRAAATTAMQAGLAFADWLDAANTLFPNAGVSGSADDERPGLRGGVFFGLVPEVGRYLHDTNLAAASWYIDDVNRYPTGDYLWYATRAGCNGELTETSFQSPEPGWAFFLAEAYVRGAPRERLLRWLDRPWGLGDPWHIQKIVAAIEAP